MTPILDQYLCATWYVAVCSAAEGALAPMGEKRGGAYRGGRPPIACFIWIDFRSLSLFSVLFKGPAE